MSGREDWVDEDPGDPALHAELASLLRAATPVAPPVVARRALGRIRIEHDVLLIARTLGGALARVATALPDYLPHTRRR